MIHLYLQACLKTPEEKSETVVNKRQKYNGQKNKAKETYYGRQNTIQKAKDKATRTPLKIL